MKQNVRSVITKVIILIILWVLFTGLSRIFMPIWTNEMALNQLKLSSQSYTTFAAWQVITGWIVLLLSLISFLIFIPNVMAFVKYRKDLRKKDEIKEI